MAKDDNGKYQDEDEKEGGCLLDKYKLKLIVDNRKVDKLDMNFFKWSTCDTMDNGDDWKVIFEETDTFECYAGNNTKTIQLNQKNDRYLQLKFYTTDPAEYKWDSDQNIKNVTANKICCGINLLRKSKGGKISKDEKHFIKFLLCFQNKQNYKEMLYSAKLVMGLLIIDKYECDKNKWYSSRKAMFWPNDVKPLSEEWQKLEAEKSFVTSDDLAMEYLNLIAYKLDGGFQKAMKDLFKENGEKLNR